MNRFILNGKLDAYIYIYIYIYIQGVPGGKDPTSGECSLGVLGYIVIV